MRIIIFLSAFAVSQFTFAQMPIEIQAKLPQVAGWSISEIVEIFDSGNLYERINGAAPGFFMFNFKELTCLEYIQNTADDHPSYIVIQVYRHASHEDAFGIYASERPSESNFMTIGTEGYQEGTMLNFFVNDLYVKMESPSVDESVVNTIQQIAREFGRNINPQPAFPVQLQMFPAENKIPRSELYIPTGFLGHEFLINAFTANYQVAGKKYQLFIIDAGNVDQAKATLTKYLQFAKQNTRLREGRLTIRDRFNGDIECQWAGRYIWGIVNDSNAPVKVDEVLNQFKKL